MDVQNELDKIKAMLDEGEQLDVISGGFRNRVQEKFWLLLTLVDQQQQDLGLLKKLVDSTLSDKKTVLLNQEQKQVLSHLKYMQSLDNNRD